MIYSMNVTDIGMLVKYKRANWTDRAIAAKLGVSVEEVARRWREILDRASQMSSSGYDQLNIQYQILCQQYQLLGESLKIIAAAIGNGAEPSDIRPLITPDPEETIKNLMSKLIVLRPFTPMDPAESLKATEKRTCEGN